MSHLPLSLFGLSNIVALLVVWAFVRHPAWLKPAVPRPPVKGPLVYWAWRIYTAIVLVGFWSTWLDGMLALKDEAFDRMVYWFPFFAVAVFAVFTAFAFPFAYSAFGKRRRTPLPDEPPLRTIENSWAIIVKQGTGPMTWLFYPHGVGLRIAFTGSVFLPWQEIETLVLQRGNRSMLYHCCPEVRGPIRVPHQVAHLMADMLRSQYPNRVVDEAGH